MDMVDDTEYVFSDKSVTFTQYIEALATRLALKLSQVNKTEEEICQLEAYRRYGKCDVLRWKKSGMLKPSRVSPGKVRYKVIDLEKLARIQQNYLIKTKGDDQKGKQKRKTK